MHQNVSRFRLTLENPPAGPLTELSTSYPAPISALGRHFVSVLSSVRAHTELQFVVLGISIFVLYLFRTCMSKSLTASMKGPRIRLGNPW